MLQASDFEEAAENIFCRSLNAFLAKSISALVARANEKDLFIDLSVRVVKSQFKEEFPCALSCLFLPPNSMEKGYLWALIYIHPKCTKKFAKFAVGHELGHLFHELESLKSYKNKNGTTIGWQPASGIEPTPVKDPILEANCNLFATRLAGYHHYLNCNFGLRKKFKLFPYQIVGNPAQGAIQNIHTLNPEFQVGDKNSPDFDTVYSLDYIFGFADILHCISPCSSPVSSGEYQKYCDDCHTSAECSHKQRKCPQRGQQRETSQCMKCPDNQLCQFYSFKHLQNRH